MALTHLDRSLRLHFETEYEPHEDFQQRVERYIERRDRAANHARDDAAEIAQQLTDLLRSGEPVTKRQSRALVKALREEIELMHNANDYAKAAHKYLNELRGE